LGLSQEHLVKWGGIQTASLTGIKQMRDKGLRVQLYVANLWLHTDGEPFKLKIDEGIGVYETGGPRLPTLGLRALTNSKLQMLIYGDTMQAIIRTPPKWHRPL
jgi:hypothetical protein